MQKFDLDALNEISAERFAENFGYVFEHSPWVMRIVAQARPFADFAALKDAMRAAVHSAPIEQKLALLRAHPELAGKAAQAGALTIASQSEQKGAGLGQLSAAESERLHTQNRDYGKKFGFPFIICVRQHTKTSIVEQMEARLANDAEIEVGNALSEVLQIAMLRLATHLREPENFLAGC